MSRLVRNAVLALGAVLTLGTNTLLAREEIPAETRRYSFDANLAACESALSTIQSRFRSTERRYWNSNAEIISFEQVGQAAFRPHGLDLVPRRYCQAVAVMADKRRLKLRYAIIEDGGFAGIWDGVQYCLDGYDRNHTAMAGCARLDR